MNEHPRLTEFSGVVGQVLGRSIGFASLASGFALTMILFGGGFILGLAGAPEIAFPFSQIVIAFAMARFALNGMFGEWGGSLFSSSGGSVAAVGAVALRYLVLSALWIVPAMVLAPGQDELAAAAMMGPAAAGGMGGLLLVYTFGMVLTPPIFLIVATRSGSFGEMFSPATWSEMFRGRIGDLFVIYAIYTGGVGMVLVLALPFVFLAFMAKWQLGVFVAGVCFLLLIGISANLLGRLCGFFACGDLGLDDPDLSTADPVDPYRPSAPRPALAGPSSMPLSGGGADPESPGIAVPSMPVSIPVHGVAPGSPIASSAGSPIAAGAAALAAAPDPELSAADRRPPLMDAQQRIDALSARFEKEPDGVLAALADLQRSYAPHPLVLESLSIFLSRAGRGAEGLELAREALPLCFERGHSHPAAKIVREYRDQIDALELSRDQTLTVAAALQKMGDLGNAAKTFTVILTVDPGEIRAIKGLLQVGDEILHKRNNPKAAAKVYRYLLQHSGTSPLAEYMQRGLDEAERSLSSVNDPGAPAAPGSAVD